MNMSGKIVFPPLVEVIEGTNFDSMVLAWEMYLLKVDAWVAMPL